MTGPPLSAANIVMRNYLPSDARHCSALLQPACDNLGLTGRVRDVLKTRFAAHNMAGYTGLVATVGSDIIGVIGVYQGAPEAYIDLAATANNKLGLLVGLVLAAEKKAVESGASSISVTAFPPQSSFYVGLGYRSMGVGLIALGDYGVRAEGFRKVLSG